jgi:hypothetical protein
MQPIVMVYKDEIYENEEIPPPPKKRTAIKLILSFFSNL